MQNHIAMSAQRPAVFVHHHHSVPIVGEENISYNELATDFDEVEYAYRPEYKKKTEQISKIKTQKETLNYSFSYMRHLFITFSHDKCIRVSQLQKMFWFCSTMSVEYTNPNLL